MYYLGKVLMLNIKMFLLTTVGIVICLDYHYQDFLSWTSLYLGKTQKKPWVEPMVTSVPSCFFRVGLKPEDPPLKKRETGGALPACWCHRLVSGGEGLFWRERRVVPLLRLQLNPWHDILSLSLGLNITDSSCPRTPSTACLPIRIVPFPHIFSTES